MSIFHLGKHSGGGLRGSGDGVRFRLGRTPEVSGVTHVPNTAARVAIDPATLTPGVSRVVQDDALAMVVTGGSQPGTYTRRLQLYDRPYFTKVGYGDSPSLLGIAYSTNIQADFGIYNSPVPGWVITTVNETSYAYSTDDVDDPSLCTSWYNAGDNTPAGITVTGQALTYQYNGPRDTLPARIVAGGTQPGIYRRGDDQNGRPFFAINYDGNPTARTIYWDELWYIFDGEGSTIYVHENGEALLPPVSGWIVAGIGPADITVTAGIVLNVAGYFVSGGAQVGIYTVRGIPSGSVYGTLLGAPSDSSFSALSRGVNSEFWDITNGDGNLLHVSPDDVPTPDLCGRWYDATVPDAGQWSVTWDNGSANWCGNYDPDVYVNGKRSLVRYADDVLVGRCVFEPSHEVGGEMLPDGWVIYDKEDNVVATNYVDPGQGGSPPTSFYRPGNGGTTDVVTVSEIGRVTITVTPVTQGQLDAACSYNGLILSPLGTFDGRATYESLTDGTPVTWQDGLGWNQETDPSGLGNTAFPWDADWSQNSPAPTVTRWDNVAANWSVVP